MTSVTVGFGGGLARVSRDADGVEVVVSSGAGGDKSFLMTEDEAVELSRALAFVAGRTEREVKNGVG